jgi:hypothetical protein
MDQDHIQHDEYEEELEIVWTLAVAGASSLGQAIAAFSSARLHLLTFSRHLNSLCSISTLRRQVDTPVGLDDSDERRDLRKSNCHGLLVA